MAPTIAESDIQPLVHSRKPIMLPGVAAQLALGASSKKTGPREVTVVFEGSALALHETDFRICEVVGKRLHAKYRLGEARQAGVNELIAIVVEAHRMVAEAVFRPGAIKVLYFPVASQGSAFYRCTVPCISISKGTKCAGYLSAGSAREALEYDVVVIQIASDPATIQFAGQLRDMGKKVVFEFDDAFDSLEPWHPQYANYAKTNRRELMLEMMGLADAVTVSTPALADRFRKYARKIAVIPNLVDVGGWPRAERHADGTFRILWAGSPSHVRDFEPCADALATITKRHRDVRLVFFGYKPRLPEVDDRQVEFHRFVPFSEYAPTLAELAADVAIAPLADVDFNRYKSNVKLLEYQATGYPVVASPVGPYAAHPGVLMASTTADWVERLESLKADADGRRKLAADGFEAASAFDMEKNRPLLEEFFAGLMGGKR